MDEYQTKMAVRSAPLGSRLLEMRDKLSFTDIMITCHSLALPAHKCVLAAGSQFFKLLFEQAEEKRVTFNLSDSVSDSSILQTVIDFLYTGDIVLSLDSLVLVAELAEYLAIGDLTNLCEVYLGGILTEDNCLKVYLSLIKPKLASQTEGHFSIEDDSLLQVAWDVVEGRFYSHLLQHEQILQVSTEDMLHLMSRGVLKHFSIQKVLDFLLRWLQHRPGEGEVVDLFLSLVLERVQLASHLHHYTSGIIPSILSSLQQLQTALDVCSFPDDLRLTVADKLNALTDLVRASVGESAALATEVSDSGINTLDKTDGELCDSFDVAKVRTSTEITGDVLEVRDVPTIDREELVGESADVGPDVASSSKSLIGTTCIKVADQHQPGSETVFVGTDTVENVHAKIVVSNIQKTERDYLAEDQQRMQPENSERQEPSEVMEITDDLVAHSDQLVGVAEDFGDRFINNDIISADTQSTSIAGVVAPYKEMVGGGRDQLNNNIEDEVEDTAAVDDIQEGNTTAVSKSGTTDMATEESSIAAVKSGSQEMNRVHLIKVEKTGTPFDEDANTLDQKDTDILRAKSLQEGQVFKRSYHDPTSDSSVLERVKSYLQQQQQQFPSKKPRGRPPSSAKRAVSLAAPQNPTKDPLQPRRTRHSPHNNMGKRPVRQKSKRKWEEEYEVSEVDARRSKKKKGVVLKMRRGKVGAKKVVEVKEEQEEIVTDGLISEEEEKKLLMKNLYLKCEVSKEKVSDVGEDQEEETEEQQEVGEDDENAGNYESDIDWIAHATTSIKKKEGKQYPCDLCSKVFKTRYCLTRHRNIHEGKKEHHCMVCGMLFGRGYHLLRHLRSVHYQLEVFTCNICDEEFTDPKAIVAHCRNHNDAKKGGIMKEESEKEMQEVVDDVTGASEQLDDEVDKQFEETEDAEGNKTFLCKICESAFENEELVKTHIAEHFDQKANLCSECGEEFDNKKLLKEHIKDVHKIEASIYTCEKCQRTYTLLSKFLIHKRACQKGFRCDQCSASFHTRYHLSRHMTVHSTLRSYSCEHCPKLFKTKQKMREHMKREHESSPEARVVVCELCGMVLKDIKYLRRHLDTHKGIKLHQCPVCLKSYTQGTGLQVHMRIHTGSKPFQCEICSMLFSVKSNLMRHQRRHRGDRRHKCDQCGKGFVMMSDLKRHYTMHTGEKNYPCRFCGKCFSTKSKLPQHERIHTGERPYECRVCHKRFTQNGDRKRHEATHGTSAPVPYKPRMSLFEIANGTNEFDSDKEGEADTSNNAAESLPADVGDADTGSVDQKQVVTSVPNEGIVVKSAEDLMRAVAGQIHLAEGAALITKYAFPQNQFF